MAVVLFLLGWFASWVLLALSAWATFGQLGVWSAAFQMGWAGRVLWGATALGAISQLLGGIRAVRRGSASSLMLVVPASLLALACWLMATEPYNLLAPVSLEVEANTNILALGLSEEWRATGVQVLVAGAFIAQAGWAGLAALLGREPKFRRPSGAVLKRLGIATTLMLLWALIGGPLDAKLRIAGCAAFVIAAVAAIFVSAAFDAAARAQYRGELRTVGLCLLGACCLWIGVAWWRAQSDLFWQLYACDGYPERFASRLPPVLAQAAWARTLPLLLLPCGLLLETLLPRDAWREALKGPRLGVWALGLALLGFGGAVFGRTRAQLWFAAANALRAPSELTEISVPKQLGWRYGTAQMLFITDQAVYTRQAQEPIKRLTDATALDGPACVEALAQLPFEGFPLPSVLLDRAAKTHTLACILVYFSRATHYGNAQKSPLGYNIEPTYISEGVWVPFLVAKEPINVPPEFAVFGRAWTQLALKATFSSRGPYGGVRPPHVHLSALEWRYRVDEDRQQPAKRGSVIGSTEQRLEKLRAELGDVYRLHLSADLDVPAADVLRVSLLAREAEFYLPPDPLKQLEPAEVQVPYERP